MLRTLLTPLPILVSCCLFIGCIEEDEDLDLKTIQGIDSGIEAQRNIDQNTKLPFQDESSQPISTIPTSPISRSAPEWVSFNTGSSGSARKTAGVEPVEIVSSSARNLALHVSLSGMSVLDTVMSDRKEYTSIHLKGGGELEIGKPDVPVLRKWILVPAGTEVSMRITPGEPLVFDDMDIPPLQRPSADFPGSVPPPFEIDDVAYETDEDFPGVLARTGPVLNVRGQDMLIVDLYPLQYNPVTGELRVYSDLSVDLQFEGEILGIPKRLENPVFKKAWQRLALNAEEVLAAQDETGVNEPDDGSAPMPDGNGVNGGCDYLIICHPSFVNEANTLAAWKRLSGFRTKVVTTTVAGSTDMAIETYINSSQSWTPAPAYVLLIGDAEYLPTAYRLQHPIDYYNDPDGLRQGYVASDRYYADTTGNNVADLYIGRLPVDTATEAGYAVDRIIDYERTPPNPGTYASYYTKATIAAYYQDSDPQNNYADRRFAKTSEDIYQFLSASEGYTTQRIYYAHGDVTPTYWTTVSNYVFENDVSGGSLPSYLLKPTFPWDGDKADITSAINAGTFLVTHRDHGSRRMYSVPSGYWYRGGWGDPEFEPTDAIALSNGSLSQVLWSINCSTGWFDNETDDATYNRYESGSIARTYEARDADECFCERFIRDDNGGAVGVIGATRISYSGRNDRLAWGWMDAIWPGFIEYNNGSYGGSDPIYQMGPVFEYGKNYFLTWYSSTNRYTRTTLDEFHWFGDPTMEIRTDVPTTLTVTHPSAIDTGVATDAAVNVKTGGSNLVDARVTISRASVPDDYWTGLTDASGDITFSGMTTSQEGDYDVVVTAHNTIPYEGTMASAPLLSVDFTADAQSHGENIGAMTITAELSETSSDPVTVPFTLSGDATEGSGSDYTITASPVTIPAGNLSTTITITVNEDALDENNETIIVTMGNPVNASKGTTSVHTATIEDNDATPSVQFTQSAQSQAENIGTMTVTAQLSPVSGRDVVVPFNLSGTATEGSGWDYTITPTPVTISAGAVSTSITISVNDDDFDEPDETVIVTMQSPTNATTGATTVHTATIEDNDAAPSVTVSDQEVDEDGGNGIVTVTLANKSATSVSVDYGTSDNTATAGSDYTTANDTLTWAAGTTGPKTFSVPIIEDVDDEGDETVNITLSNPTNGAVLGNPNTATLTIKDNDSTPPNVTFTEVSQSHLENVGTMTITAQLSKITGLPVIVPFALSGSATEGGGADYTITSSPITIPASTLSAAITITVNDDELDENTENLVVNMGTPTNATAGAITVHTATIEDNDTMPSVQFTAATQMESEGVGTMTVTAQLSAASGLAVTVPFTVGGTASVGAGQDYTINTSPLNIPAGSTSSSITLTINDDTLDEYDETVIVTMGTPTNATAGSATTHTATIQDNDAAPSVQFTASSQIESEGVGTMPITAELSAASGLAVTVPFTRGGTATEGAGADYTTTASPLNISAGSMSASITLTVNDDDLDEDDETVIVTMGAPTNASPGATTVHTATIQDNEAMPTISFTQGTQGAQENAGTMTVTAQLSEVSARTVTAPFTLGGTATEGAGQDYTITTSPVSIPAGSLSTNVTITINDDTLDEPWETVVLTMGTPTNATLGVTTVHAATIQDQDSQPIVQFTAASQTESEAVGTMTVTAELSGESGYNITIPFSLDGTATAGAGMDYTISASPLSIPAGSLSASITISANDDNEDENDETVVVTMGNISYATPGAITVHTATIVDNDDPPTVQFTAASQTGSESVGTMTVTAQLANVSGLDVSVPFTIGGTATEGATEDFTLTASPVTIPAGSLSTDIPITVNDDGLFEDDETAIVTLGTPVNATLGAITAHTATIENNDVVPSIQFATASQVSFENNGDIHVGVELSGISFQDVNVPFFLGGTATEGAGEDYTIEPKSATVPAGSLSATVVIMVNNDGLDEDDETVELTMSTPSNATLGTLVIHTATIYDDDPTPSLQFTEESQTGAEDIGEIIVTAELSKRSGLEVTVPFTLGGNATLGADGDYTATASPVTIPAGERETTIILTIIDDERDEVDETVVISMGNPAGATRGEIREHTATILDDDVGEEDGGTPPVDEDGGTPPVDEDGGTPPVDEDGGTPPVDEDGGTPPVDEDGGTPPVDEDGGAPPAKTDAGDDEGSDDGSCDCNTVGRGDGFNLYWMFLIIGLAILRSSTRRE